MEEILIKALKGDKSAEERLFQYIRVRFEYIAKRRLQNDEDAGDIAQDACLTVLEKYKTSTNPENFEAWSYKVLRNKIGNYLQSKAVQKDKVIQSEEAMNTASRTLTESDPNILRALMDCMRRLISIYPRYARVLNFIHQGYGTEEICSQLNIKPNNFYVILNRSRKMLKECMDKEEEK